MDSQPTVQRLMSAARAAVRAGEPIARLTVFHDAVCDHVRARRADGLAPETVLVEVKKLVGHSFADESGPAVSSRASRLDREDMVGEVAQWCIEAYYRPH